MSHFFQPNSKVQKDRHVMRETDARMAKYSRRGLIFNFIAFLVCLVGGRFIQENKELTAVLASGLLLVTILRGYYLFRFDQHYPRGPARWRNKYFVVTLLGAFWWGVILASITLVLGLKDETPLIWLYTVVFFSTTAHAFAPYHRFLSYYQFLGLVPAAGAAVIVGEWSGYIYGGLMLMFYLILSHQCRLISDNYWEKLEAGYALSNRSHSNDAERSNKNATIQLNKEFSSNLFEELNAIHDGAEQKTKAQLVSKLESLVKNVELFKSFQSRQLTNNLQIFNVRHELQSITAEFIDLAESKEIQIETSLSPSLPMRLKGDPVRLAQITRTLLSETLNVTKSATLILEVQFLREYESAGELHVSVKQNKTKAAGMQFFTEIKKKNKPNSLNLTVAKAMAEMLDGEVELIETQDDSFETRFSARLEIVASSNQLDFHKDRFHGKQMLFVSSSPSIAALKRQELDALGFTTNTETQLKRAKQTLIQHLKSGTPIDNVLIYHEPNSEPCNQLLVELRESEELVGINKIIATSESEQVDLQKNGYRIDRGFYFVSKPVGLFELESTFDYIYNTKGDELSLRNCKQGTVILLGDKIDLDVLEISEKSLPNQKLVHCEKEALAKHIQAASNVMVVVPCSKGGDADEIVALIREQEALKENDDKFIPVIGVGSGCSESEIHAYEIGFDDFIDLSSTRSVSLASTLRYWRSLV